MVKIRDGVGLDKEEAMKIALELNDIKAVKRKRPSKHVYVEKNEVIYELRGMKKCRIRTLIRKIRNF